MTEKTRELTATLIAMFEKSFEAELLEIEKDESVVLENQQFYAKQNACEVWNTSVEALYEYLKEIPDD